MAYVKTILCLANSRKTTGRCIAGREITAKGLGGWIRPVSGRPTAEISEYDRRYQDGTLPAVGDIIQIQMLEPRPHGFQVENHLIDEKTYWVRQGQAAPALLRSAIDGQTRPLWLNESSSYNGMYDRVAEDRARPDDGSLRLIEVNDLVVQVSVEGAEFGNGKRRVRGRFTHTGARHVLSITDPEVERRYLAGADGNFRVGNAILCISLGEPYQGYAYKLIAAVLQA